MLSEDYLKEIGHRYRLDEIETAVRLVKNYDDGVIKAIVDPARWSATMP